MYLIVGVIYCRRELIVLTAVAVGETVLAEIDRGLFLFLVHESSTFALGIMGALATRLRNYDELFGASNGVNGSNR